MEFLKQRCPYIISSLKPRVHGFGFEIKPHGEYKYNLKLAQFAATKQPTKDPSLFRWYIGD